MKPIFLWVCHLRVKPSTIWPTKYFADRYCSDLKEEIK